MTQEQQDRLVKIMLVVFISLIAFSAGTFVGKQVVDSDNRRIQLEQEMSGLKELLPGVGQ